MAETIGPYTLHEPFGEGGMGMVYRATQEKPVRRTVALKVIKAGLDTKNFIARFEAERQALALMDHAGIAKVFDSGETDTGRPYFAMEVVAGDPIVDYCQSQNLSRADRLRLFTEVCRAVEHAHQKGIIHRDLKPSNILVRRDEEGRSVPTIIDFGIAKAIAGNEELTERTLFTHYVQVLGTPAYMAPEQLDVSGLDVDTRTDIYALGVLLYQLLTDRLPFDAERLNKASATELEQILHEEDPPRPSKHLSELSGDLDWIVLKALEKSPAQRYDGVSKFREDVMAYLEHEPVSATPPSARYLLSKYLRRHRVAVAFAGTVFTLLLAGIGISTWQAIRATRAERAEEEKSRLAVQRQKASDAMLDFITLDMLGQARPSEQADRDVKLTTVLEGASEKVNAKFQDQPRIRCFMNLRLASIYENLGRFEEADVHAEQARSAWQQWATSARADDAVEAAELKILDADITYQAATHQMGRSSFALALPLLQEALAKNMACRGLESQVVADIHQDLGFTYHGLGKLAEAAPELVKALELYKEYHPEDFEARVITLTATLAQVHEQLGNVGEADAYLRETESHFENLTLREDHPVRIATLNNLALVYMRRQEPERAVEMLEKCHRLVAVVFGEKHLRMAKSQHSLAVCYTMLGRHEEAFPLYQKAWASQRDRSGPGNEWTLINLRDLMMCAGRLGHREVQSRYVDELIEETHQNFGDNHYLMKVAIDHYGKLWEHQPAKISELHRRLSGEENWAGLDVLTLLPKGASWHYHVGSEPPANWMEPQFDASTWPVGKAPLGYGEGEIVTVIPGGVSPGKKWAGSYFVSQFARPEDVRLAKLRLRVRRDDGLVIYLNGQELVREGLPERPSWDTYASREVGGLEEKLYYVTEIDPELLQDQNTVAVQVHQCNEGSSDVFFDLTLEALKPSVRTSDSSR